MTTLREGVWMSGQDADPADGSDDSAEFLLLSPKDWSLARKARLAALRESPETFLPRRPHESSWKSRRWRRSCRTGRWAVARADGMTVGLARLTDERDGLHLGSVWTHPGYRRRGIASGLVRRLLDHAAGNDVFVWVIRPNEAAFRFYESLKFERTNEVHALDGIGRVEERLRFGPAQAGMLAMPNRASRQCSRDSASNASR
jgi:ribosomal protein S18 acetylase RimI-like enzyme